MLPCRDASPQLSPMAELPSTAEFLASLRTDAAPKKHATVQPPTNRLDSGPSVSPSQSQPPSSAPHVAELRQSHLDSRPCLTARSLQALPQKQNLAPSKSPVPGRVLLGQHTGTMEPRDVRGQTQAAHAANPNCGLENGMVISGPEPPCSSPLLSMLTDMHVLEGKSRATTSRTAQGLLSQHKPSSSNRIRANPSALAPLVPPPFVRV